MNEEELTAAREYDRLKTKRCSERKKATETIKIAPVPKRICDATGLWKSH